MTKLSAVYLVVVGATQFSPELISTYSKDKYDCCNWHQRFKTTLNDDTIK